MRLHFRFVVLLFVALVLVGLSSCENSVTPPATGKMHIFVYGNDYSYGVGSSGSPFYHLDGTFVGYGKQLKGTVNDAIQVGLSLCALAQKAGYDYEGTFMLGTAPHDKVVYPKVTVVDNVLLDVFLTELEALSARVSDEDICIFFFSGHGFGNKEMVEYSQDTTEQSYFGFRQIRQTPGITDVTSSVLYPASLLLSRIGTIPGTKVVLGDFCFSGAMIRPGNVSVTPDEYTGIDATRLFFDYRNDICESSNLFCLSAARYYERSWEPGDGGHGYFTAALLEALGWDEKTQSLTTPKALDGSLITLFGVANYVTHNDGKAAQTPMVSGGSNDIILFSL